MHIYMQVFNEYRRQEIKDKGSMQARWRINAPAVMDSIVITIKIRMCYMIFNGILTYLKLIFNPF